MFRRECKIKLIHNWVQIISPCSQGLARCRVTRQRCSVAPEPKLSAEQKFFKLRPSHMHVYSQDCKFGGSFSVWGQTYFEYYYTAIAC